MAKTKIKPEERKFDRIPHFDERSRNYPMRTVLAGGVNVQRSYTWKHIQLDQGREGACTGFSATMEAAARPAPLFGMPTPYSTRVLNSFASRLYARAKQLDEWPGEDYDGSSVLGACKAGMEAKIWSQYSWANFDDPSIAAQEITAAIGFHGPVMMGTWWKEGMFDADGEGYLHAIGENVGGHAWLLTAYSKSRDAVWTPNNWGGAGQGWLSRADLIVLLADEGEACIPAVRSTKKIDPSFQFPTAA